MQEQEQFKQLRKIRRLATGLFVLMTVLFFSARLLEPGFPALSFVRAFAEAAMVGALADWFAVTALFRSPLGLPIPHTAIIPKNKNRVGESIAGFLQYNFMTPEVIGDELGQVDFAGMTAHYLVQPAHSRIVAVQIAGWIPALLRMISDEDVARFMRERVMVAVKNVRLAPYLAEVLTILVADRRHQALFDHMIGLAANALEQNRSYLRKKVHERSPRWIPRAIDDRFFERMLEGLQSILDDMKREDSEWRDRFQQSMEEWIEKLRTSAEYEEKIDALLMETLRNPMLRNYIDQVWRDVKQRLLADIESDESRTVAKLDELIRTFNEALMKDMAVRAKFNHWLSGVVTEAIVDRRAAIAQLVIRVIQKWDAETISRKFELQVGKDLQYIRINGTLVGGMVGLLLHIISLSL